MWLIGVAQLAGASGPAHHSLYLASVVGLSDSENDAVASSICHGLLDANGAEVTCPDSIRGSLEINRIEALLTGQPPASHRDPLAEAELIDLVVNCKVEAVGGLLAAHLALTSKSAGRELARRDFKAKSFEELVLQARPEAEALLR